jgi:hypothetical protein
VKHFWLVFAFSASFLACPCCSRRSQLVFGSAGALFLLFFFPPLIPFVLGRSEDVASQRAMIEMLRTMLKGGGGDGASSSGPKADGEHSTTPGPAPCKLKHWYESREVDYVIKVYGHILGFNVVDNPIKVAEAFVVKHSLNPRSTDNTQLVMAIAEKIRQTTAPPAARGRTGQEALADLELNLEEEIKKGAQLNPYADGYEGPTVIRPHGEAGGVTAVYNHQTKQVDVIHYHNEVDAETLKRRDEEDAKRRLAQRERDEAKRRKEHELAEVCSFFVASFSFFYKKKNIKARKLVARNTAEKRTSEAVRPSFAVQPKNPAMASLSRPAKEQLKPKMEVR